MHFDTLLNTVNIWLETYIFPERIFALIGLVGVLIVIFGILAFGYRIVAGIVRRVTGYSTSVRAKKLEIAGYKILLGPIGSRTVWRRRLKNVLVGELGDYLFSSTFVLLDTPGLSRDPKRVAELRMERSNADLVIWGDAIYRDKKPQIELYCLRRLGSGRPLRTHLMIATIPGTREFWREEAGWSLVSYIIAHGLQPILSTPGAFRQEKVAGLIDKLKVITESGILEYVDKNLATRILSDYSNGALLIAQQANDVDLVDSVILLRRNTLRHPETLAVDELIDAKMQLGQALILRSEQKYDNNEVAEAMTQLADAVELLKKEPRIKQAQSANDSLMRAQGLIESRKRFSLNFG